MVEGPKKFKNARCVFLKDLSLAGSALGNKQAVIMESNAVRLQIHSVPFVTCAQCRL